MIEVGILTCFRHLSSASSLVHVVENHIEMLLKHNYSVYLLVAEGCPLDERFGSYLDERIRWGFICNTYHSEEILWKDYYDSTVELPPNFDKQVEAVSNSFYEHLEHLSLCFIHDIHYEPTHYIHNIALRRILPRLPHLRLLAFTHSFPFFRPTSLTERIRPRFTPLEHTDYVYPTQAGLLPLSEQYNVPIASCHVVYHPVSKLAHPFVKKLHEKVDLFAPDLLVIYPARLTIYKKQDKIIQFIGALKLIGNLSVRLICCDTLSDTKEAEDFKKKLYQLGYTYGLNKQDMIFTSDLGFVKGLPHEAIMELFSLSNLFICPSLSESFSLITMEAASLGNYIVLNENVPALKELGDLIHAYFMKWDAREDRYNIEEVYNPSEASYYGFHAGSLLHKMKTNPLFIQKTTIRQRFNIDWIWENQLLPLIKEILK